MTRLTRMASWKALSEHRNQIESTHLRQLFADDDARAQRLSLKAAGLYLDYSKNRITDQTLTLLMDLARECELETLREAMFSGAVINNTEKRPVLHTALRDQHNDTILADGENVIPEVRATLERMQAFVRGVHEGTITGYQGDTFTDVVSIGIGGSFLGPKIMTQALRPYWRKEIQCHFVANIDGTSLTETLKKLDPKTTLFITASKSFSTQETLVNSQSARQWFIDSGAPESAIGEHFIAISANVDAANRFGIKEENIFPMWDWVGGRYSLWSAIGLPIALQLGFEHFQALLKGAESMDRHFQQAPLEQNMPVIMGLLSVWYNDFFHSGSQAILCYDHYLRGLPAYIQQLDMESNGKGVTRAGVAVDYATGPVIWGGEGTNGQHAYHQLLHQGSRLIPVDFILPLVSHNPIGQHHTMLASNCFAQAQALMLGKTEQEAKAELAEKALPEEEKEALVRHKVMPGNKPSNMLLMDKVTPETLGAMIALYEHRTFVQGAIWGLNSFDQWGVELGKVLGNAVLEQLESEAPIQTHDGSTADLINRFRRGKL